MGVIEAFTAINDQCKEVGLVVADDERESFGNKRTGTTINVATKGDLDSIGIGRE
jgi:hypothetical protein